MKKLLCFQTLITPMIMQVLFCLGIIVCLVLGLMDLIGKGEIRNGLEILVLGPLVLRVITESGIVLFQINEHLAALRGKRL